MSNIMYKKIHGFTLIEILVVISIISVLAGVLYANFSGARAEARDKVRKNTVMEMQIALQLYKATYGVYPERGCGVTTGWVGPGTHSEPWGNNTSCEEYIVGLAPDFIAELPRDPNQEYDDNTGYIYQVDATRTAYKFLSHRAVEQDFVEDYDHPLSRCPEATGSLWCGSSAPQQDTYAVYSFGAEDW